MKEEKVCFYSCQQKIAGVLHSPDESNDKAIVMVHGITVDKDKGGMFVSAARKFCNDGYTVLRFDFRGHGESDGDSIDLTVEGEIKDLDEAFNFIKNKGFTNIGILAASFGGSITSLYTSKNKNIKVIVFWYPLLNYENVFLKPITEWGIKNFSGKGFEEKMKNYGYISEHKGFRFGKKLFETMKGIYPGKCLENINIPILIIHGNKDTYVPYEDSKRYSKMAKNSELLTIEGADHGFDEDENIIMAINASLDWFNKWM